MLKITRKRTVHQYFCMIELASMKQGYSDCEIYSLRWKRLQCVISSIERHLAENFGMDGVYV